MPAILMPVSRLAAHSMLTISCNYSALKNPNVSDEAKENAKERLDNM